MVKSVKALENDLKDLSLSEQEEVLLTYKDDERKGIRKLIETFEKNIEKEQKEKDRLKKMTLYETDAYKKGYKVIAGIDEVGRGPLAGPVVVCAVILNDLLIYTGINDSKKVSLKNRHRLFEAIDETAVSIGYGLATPEEIDALNILNATKLAMDRAIAALDVQPDCLLIDAVHLDMDIPQYNIIKGDEKSVTIAAASIMAKVTRDEMMIAYEKTYPGYDFQSNKGYGTKNHYEGLNKLGYTAIHRKSFIKEYL